MIEKPLFPEFEPKGLEYEEQFISPEEEKHLLAQIGCYGPGDWENVVYKGYPAKRREINFGYKYLPDQAALSTAQPIPSWLYTLIARVATQASVNRDSLQQVSIISYPEQAGIGTHIDKAVFGDIIITLSLLSYARMLFEREKIKFELVLEPRSILIMKGESRSNWSHKIFPVKKPRMSITFRQLA